MRLIDLEKERDLWSSKGYTLYSYDRDAMVRRTRNTPVWIHFGAGNLFRAFQAVIAEDLLEKGYSDTGVIAVSGTHSDMIDKCYRPFDDLHISVTLRKDGTMEKRVIGSVAESVKIEDMERLSEIFSAPSLQVVSFTITEKGYRVPENDPDLTASPSDAKSYMGRIASLLCTRYRNGAFPLTLCSHDNCSHNGEKLYGAVVPFADAWVKNGKADPAFASYVRDEKLVSFPWSMIDKITPRPDASVEAILRADGLEDLDPVVTTKKTWVAPFVNAEETEYLVVEDAFPNGRPALEKAGVIFTDRDTVNKVERMKVTTCLNPLHTALAVYGCLLGCTKISDEMKDPDLTALVRRLGYQEGLPVVVNPGVLDPKEFIDTVVNVRVPNPFMPDTPQRIATDTSQKLAIRYGETIKSYLADPKLSVNSLRMIPLVQAGWLRYVMAVDDDGRAFEPSPDPMLSSVQQVVSVFRVGSPVSAEEAEKNLRPLLTDDKLFGVDLEKAGLADRVCGYFVRELTGPGAVRKTIEEALNE